ncbi:MAG TPA: hypothetical protein VKA25_09145, partial [Gemmatimonadales bacterium]|nr:hypothetical protein [Gemmatimonadales bacterium]
RLSAYSLIRCPFPLFALGAGFLKGLTRYNPAQNLTLHLLHSSAPNLPLTWSCGQPADLQIGTNSPYFARS